MMSIIWDQRMRLRESFRQELGMGEGVGGH